MGIFVSVEKLAESIAVSCVFALALCGCVFRLLGALQECGYYDGRFADWLNKKNNVARDRHLFLSLTCAFSAAVLSLAFLFLGEYAALVSLAGFAIFMPLYIYEDNKVALKVPVAFTTRFKRLYTEFALVALLFSFVAAAAANYLDNLLSNEIFSAMRYVPLAVFPALLSIFVRLTNLLSKIYEAPHNKGFVKKASKKIAASHIKIVGVTGSYGKTSVKNYLTKMLQKKFRVLATPSSYNTPLGIARTVNDANLDEYDIFVAEMGARNTGDIFELCAICPPDYSIITGICAQHLESFGTMENLIKAKGEILVATKQAAVLENECKALFAAYSRPFLKNDCVFDIKSDCNGSTFKLRLGGEERGCSTKLLGEHAVKNIALCATCAYELGVGIDDIAKTCEELEPVEHRLQLLKNGGVNILDDGYNSSVKGADAAIEVLKLFSGKKVVVTPGLVELGVLEESENFELGQKLAGFDFVVLVGDTLVRPVKDGYLAAGGNGEKLCVVPTLEAAKRKLNLSPGDTVLFLNDLPDVYR